METLDLELHKPKFGIPRKQKAGRYNTWLHFSLSRLIMFNLIIRKSIRNCSQYNFSSVSCPFDHPWPFLCPTPSPLTPHTSSLAALTTTAWFSLRKAHIIKLGCSFHMSWQVCMISVDFFLSIALGGLIIALSGHSRNKEIITVTNKGEEHC